jgi:hypothetical protein
MESVFIDELNAALNEHLMRRYELLDERGRVSKSPSGL